MLPVDRRSSSNPSSEGLNTYFNTLHCMTGEPGIQAYCFAFIEDMCIKRNSTALNLRKHFHFSYFTHDDCT